MARRQRKSGFESAVDVLARLPWQVCLLLAPFAYLGFHLLAQIEPPATHNIGEMGSSIRVVIFRTAGMFLQYLAPLTLLIAATASWLGRRSRARLLAETEKRTKSAPLRQLSWREFEQLVAAHFERLGYAVSLTRDGADGGIDVVARKGDETFLIQCKQWRATQVGVSVVRELFGVMAAQGATGGFVVSIGPFTSDARAFADGRNIELVDANMLLRSTRPMSPASDAARPFGTTPLHAAKPRCPKCGAAMVRRVARQGGNKGQAFYGCKTYPACHGTAPIPPPAS